jgi:hypothetical protein
MPVNNWYNGTLAKQLSAESKKSKRGGTQMKSQELAQVFALMVVGAAALNAGCVAHAEGAVTAEPAPPVVFAEPPTLVAVDGGVWVVRDADYATYYVDDWYWVYRDRTWYRSRSYDGGWVVAEVAVVPTVIVHRDPAVYVHYRGESNARTRRAPHEEKAHEIDADKPNGAPGHEELHGEGDHKEVREHHDEQREERHEERAEDQRHRDAPSRSESPSGVGHERRSEGTQPGQVGRSSASAPSPKKNEKKHDK